jgi:hypothetical protein
MVETKEVTRICKEFKTIEMDLARIASINVEPFSDGPVLIFD